jgi:hypothetical protein
LKSKSVNRLIMFVTLVNRTELKILN